MTHATAIRHPGAGRDPYVDGPGLARTLQLRDGVWSIAIICSACVVRSNDRWPRWGTRTGSQTFP
jgi:hypothetical protein